MTFPMRKPQANGWFDGRLGEPADAGCCARNFVRKQLQAQGASGAGGYTGWLVSSAQAGLAECAFFHHPQPGCI
jgi:hypothetical protein